MKTQIYCVILFFVLAFTSIALFRYWIDTRLMEGIYCTKPIQTTAVLKFKTKQGACYFLIDGQSKLNEQWFTCEELNEGDVIPWADYEIKC